MIDNRDYYQRRLEEELLASDRADCARAAEAHRELADFYRLAVAKAQSGGVIVELRPNRRAST